MAVVKNTNASFLNFHILYNSQSTLDKDFLKVSYLLTIHINYINIENSPFYMPIPFYITISIMSNVKLILNGTWTIEVCNW